MNRSIKHFEIFILFVSVGPTGSPGGRDRADVGASKGGGEVMDMVGKVIEEEAQAFSSPSLPAFRILCSFFVCYLCLFLSCMLYFSSLSEDPRAF